MHQSAGFADQLNKIRDQVPAAEQGHLEEDNVIPVVTNRLIVGENELAPNVVQLTPQKEVKPELEHNRRREDNQPKIFVSSEEEIERQRHRNNINAAVNNSKWFSTTVVGILGIGCAMVLGKALMVDKQK